MQRMPSPRIASAAGVTACFGNVPLMFLNVSIVDRPAATSDDLRALLQTAVQRSASCRVSFRSHSARGLAASAMGRSGSGSRFGGAASDDGHGGDGTLAAAPPGAAVGDPSGGERRAGSGPGGIERPAYEMPLEAFECISDVRLWQADSSAMLDTLMESPSPAPLHYRLREPSTLRWSPRYRPCKVRVTPKPSCGLR